MTRDELIAHLQSDLRNERKHLNFYLYHASAAGGLHALEYREWLEAAAKGELAHVLAFQDRIWGLGGPCLRGPAANEFPTLLRIEAVLEYARVMEEEVVANYTERLKQLETADFPEARYMTIFYEDQLKDSYEDCERIRRVLLAVRS
jgi:hypothetical protein